MSEVLAKQLARAQARIRILEQMIEDKSRELFIAHVAAEQRSKRLGHLVRILPTGLWVFDPSGKPDIVNDAAIEILDSIRDRVLVHRFQQTFPEMDLSAALAETEPVQVETVLERPNGTRIPISLTMSTFTDEERGPTVVCLAVDRSHRKKLEARLRMAQKLEAVGQLAAGVAHEVNTPIQFIGDGVNFLRDCLMDLSAAIAGRDEVLADLRAGGRLTQDHEARLLEVEESADVPFALAEGPQAVERTLRGVSRVADIVRALRAFAHPATGTMTPTNVNAAIGDAIIVARGEYKHCAEVVLQLGEVPPVECDAGALNQVLLNLLVNASHAIEGRAGGGIGTITIKTERVDDSVVISVGDDGSGIPEAARSRLFEPFFTTKAMGKGTGQGLALVHAIVEAQHGGTISFDTELGVGTTFHVRLPIVHRPGRRRAA